MSRRDPYLYEDVPVLKNLPGIKDSEELKLAEGDLTRMSMGIVYARTLAGDNDSFKLPEDWYAWMPTAKHTNPQILEYARKFVDLQIEGQYIANHWPRLFYMWGHSYEFDTDNNWDHLETIFQILGGHDDIWYATNIEICNYVKAYESLEISVDGTMIYNPTVYKIWMEIDEKPYAVEPGQTITVE